MLRFRFCFHFVSLVVCMAFAVEVFAQTAVVKAIGNDTLTFEETGNDLTNGAAAFTSSVSGLKFQFHGSRATIDVGPSGAAEGRPIRLSLAGANRTPHISPEGQLPGIVSYFIYSNSGS